MAMTVEDLYREVLGREPDPEGLVNWKRKFGDDVDQIEREQFIYAAVPEAKERGIALPTLQPQELTPQQLQARAQKAYDDYYNVLRNGQVTADTIRQAYGEHDPGHVQRVLNIKAEIDAQQAAGSKEYYSAGRISADNAAWDMAFRLSEMGLSSVYDMGKRTVSRDYGNDEGGNPLIGKIDEYFNKATGEDVTDNWNRVSRSGPLLTTYNLHFTDDGMAVPYTGKETSDWVKFRETVKPIASIVLAAYGVPYVSTALGATTAGASLVAAGGQAALTGVSAGIVSGGASLLAGNDFDDALKSALTSGLSAGATAGFADTIGQTLGFDAGSVASKAAGSAIIAGAKAGIMDEDILTSMATAAVSSYLSNKDPVFDATEREGSLAKPGFDDVSMTTDFGAGADYSLGGNLKFPSGEGIKDNPNFDIGTDAGESFADYGLDSNLTFPSLEGISVDQISNAGTTVGESPVDYSLGSNLKFPSLEGIRVDQILDTGTTVGESPVDYSLGSNLKFPSLEGLRVEQGVAAGTTVGQSPVDYSLGSNLTFPSLEGIRVDQGVNTGTTVGLSPVDYSLGSNLKFPSLDGIRVDQGINTGTTVGQSPVDYSLGSNIKFPSLEGIKVEQGVDTGTTVGQNRVDYGLGGGSSGLGLSTPSSPNLTAMGGGQGLTATKPDGTTLAGTDFSTGPSTKDIKTLAKIAGVLMAGDEVVDMTIGGRDKQITGQPSSKDKYRNAPLAGFKMVKYDDPATGASKYIPFVGEEALLPPPSGYKRGYAKGGFVSKPIKSKGLASKR